MWRLVLGAILALLPRRWRDRPVPNGVIPWGHGAERPWREYGGDARPSRVVFALGDDLGGERLGLGAARRAGGGCTRAGYWVLGIGFVAPADLVYRLLCGRGSGSAPGRGVHRADFYGKLIGRPREGDWAFTPGARAQLRSFLVAVKESVRAGSTREVASWWRTKRVRRFISKFILRTLSRTGFHRKWYESASGTFAWRNWHQEKRRDRSYFACGHFRRAFRGGQ
jgi:hypothetical protein